ncbi:MAG: hypothetical protein O3A00_07620 [Planctomycetota bacterium]|nr:hypothetical protein [Planctomycetota bacterium]
MSGKIAVVAVHGVADQRKSETAEPTAALLESVGFIRNEPDAALDPAPTVHLRGIPGAQTTAPLFSIFKRLWHTFWQTPLFLRGRDPKSTRPEDLGNLFTESSVEHVRLDLDHDYETPRIGLTKNDLNVDVHEMYWADVSHPGRPGIPFFYTLYRVLFHLSHAGLKTIDAAAFASRSRNETAAGMWYRCLRPLHWLSDVCLTSVIPLLNVLLLAVLLLILPANAVEFFERADFRVQASVGFFTAAFVIAGILLFVKYGRVSPAIRLWLVPYFATGGWISHELSLVENSKAAAVQAAMFHTEWLFLVLNLAWAVLLSSMLVSFVVSLCLCCCGTIHRRVALTHVFSTMIPSTVFLYVTLALYAAGHYVSGVAVGLIQPNTEIVAGAGVKISTEFPNAVPWIYTLHDSYPNQAAFLEDLLRASAGPAFSYLFFGTLIGLGVAAVGLLRSILAKASVESPARIRALGRSLDRGYRCWFRLGILIGFLAIPVVAIIGRQLLRMPPYDAFDTSHYILAIGRILGLISIAIGVLALLPVVSGWLRRKSDVFWMALDTIQDVDVHLREHPQGRTERVRIATRLYSLLKRLSDDEYDGIVIFSHSLGSVICADLLRYLEFRRRQDGDNVDATTRKLAAIPIGFMTMGSPLRQLHNWRLPDLYAWVNPSEHGGERHGPDPLSLLGVRRWINAYCSGDFVGRSHWYEDHADERWSHELGPGEADAIEHDVCVGYGSHTQYLIPGQVHGVPKHLSDLIEFIGDFPRNMQNTPSTKEALSQ